MPGSERSTLIREFTSSGFFGLRTPLLPVEDLIQWSKALRLASAGDEDTRARAWRADVDVLRERLRAIVARPEVLKALFVASPSLVQAIEYWKREPDCKKGLQAEHALVRYFSRMAGRSTPFGLFAGCSVGRVQDCEREPAALELVSRDQYRPFSRLDNDYLFELTAQLQRAPGFREQLRYRPNSSLYRLGDKWHYIESRLGESRRTHHVVRLDADTYLNAVLEAAQHGLGLAELVQTVRGAAPASEFSPEEARDYVGELIDNEILVPTLTPLVTGRQPLDDIVDQLANLEAGAMSAGVLDEARRNLAELDAQGVTGSPAGYSEVAAKLQGLPAKPDPARLYQVDMIKPLKRAALPQCVIDEVAAGIECLYRLSTPFEYPGLKAFRKAFVERYDRLQVPLMEALDEEAGVGFDASDAPGAHASPLLQGLRLGARVAAADTPFKPVHRLLLHKLGSWFAQGGEELRLESADLLASTAVPQTLPDALAVLVTIVARSLDAIQEGDFRIVLHKAFGPSGATFFGRFCPIDPELDKLVRLHLRQEEMNDPDAIYAEVVHLPEGRVGNVLIRPVLRDREIAYVGRSGSAEESQIPVGDLLVSVANNQILLHSKRLGRRIIPRMTNAHNFSQPQLAAAYRFLCSLQYQGVMPGLSFGWGPLETLEHLPRVVFGKVVLKLATWRLTGVEIATLRCEKGFKRFQAMQDLRNRRGLPRWVLLAEGDNTLPVDLDNALSVDAFIHALRQRPQALLEELYPNHDLLCVTGPEGRFFHEIVIPFVRKPAKSAEGKPRLPDPIAAVVPRERRTLAAGSEWLYVKLYAGAATLDEILATAVRPLTESALKCGIIDRWFFIRYGDPAWHIRLRLHGEPGRLARELWPVMANEFRVHLSSGRIWKMQLDTYEREIERYGGLEGTLAAEKLFCADSRAVLEALRIREGDPGLDARWRIALLGVDRLLSDLGLDLADKRALLRRMRDLSQQGYADIDIKAQLGEKFRQHRRSLEALLEKRDAEAVDLATAHAVFERRSQSAASAVFQLKRLAAADRLSVELKDLVPSYVHMHINRMMRSAAPAHELVLYDLLYRLYNGRAARVR